MSQVDDWEDVPAADDWEDVPAGEHQTLSPGVQTAIRSTAKGAFSPIAFFMDTVNALPNLALYGAKKAGFAEDVPYLPKGEEYVNAGLRHVGVNPEAASIPEKMITTGLGVISGAGLAKAAASIPGAVETMLPQIAETIGIKDGASLTKSVGSAAGSTLGGEGGKKFAEDNNLNPWAGAAVEALGSLLGGVGSAGAMGAVGGAGKSLWRAGGSFTDDGQDAIVGRLLNRLSSAPDNSINRVGVKNTRYLDESQPTLAEVTQDPGISRLQRSLTSNTAAIDSGADPVNALRRTLMDKAATDAIDRANLVKAGASDPIERLRDFQRQTWDDWRSNNSGVENSVVPISRTTRVINDLRQQHAGKDNITNILDSFERSLNAEGPGGMDAHAFQKVWNQRQSIDDLVYEKLLTASSGSKGELRRVAGDVRAAINDDLTAANPEFSDALRKHSRAQRGISALQTGREVAEKLKNTARNLVTDENADYGDASLSGARLDKLNLDDLERKNGVRFTQAQRRAFGAAAEDARRANILQTGGAASGSPTTQNIAMNNIVAHDIAAGLLGDKSEGWLYPVAQNVLGTVGSGVGTVLGRTVQGDVMHKLSAALLDPERGAELMKNHKLGKAASFNTDLMDSVKGSLISEIFRRASGG